MKPYRVRIYSALYGVEDFVGLDLESLTRRADEKVRAYRDAGIVARYIGQI